MMTMEEVQTLLPKVGDTRWEVPTIDETTAVCHAKRKKGQRCTVVAVNTDHLWYEVEFESGLRECYKLPKVKPEQLGGLSR